MPEKSPERSPETSKEPVRLPPGLDILWGRRAPGTRGPKAELDSDRIVTAAIDLANAEGLEAVSMARVAKALGFTTMSLYRHVSSKDELLQLMWHASARGVHELELAGDTWQERLMSWAVVQRQQIEENIWIVQLSMAAPPLAPNSLAWVERGFEAMDGLDAPDHLKIRVLGLISQHSLIAARMAFDERRGKEQADREGFEYDYLTLLRELVDPEAYPHMARLAALETPNDGLTGEDPQAEFRFDVGVIIAGFEAVVG